MNRSHPDRVIEVLPDDTAMFWCPGCDTWHMIWPPGKPNPLTGATWRWNMNPVQPTIHPSIHVQPNQSQPRCHSYVRSGYIEFMHDSTHGLAGRTVPLQKVVSLAETANKP